MCNDYVLVTAARNEESVIENTIRSVAAQTVLPKKWIIVSDGSTDGTDEIVRGFARKNSFIVFQRRSDANGERSFGSKAHAFGIGYSQLRTVAHDYVGNLDADISLRADYYERILDRFRANHRLGIGGGIIHELIGGEFVPQRISLNSVAGAVQTFRRDCYEKIGGYIPLRFGGIDSAAEIIARMQGWDVQTFPDLGVHHHRRVASGGGGLVKREWRHGLRHYALGYHPLFEILRNAYKLSERPNLLGAVLMTLGYLWALVTFEERDLPEEVVRYLRSEQIERLRSMCLKAWSPDGRTKETLQLPDKD